jgi:dTDP-glucose 4,6-dehydratase
VPVLVTRSSNNFGPYQYPEKVIPLFITNALDGQPLPLYGDGKSVRDYLYVTDHCRAIDLVLHSGKEGRTYCVGGGAERDGIALAETILDLLDLPRDRIEFVADRPGHDRRYAIDATRIEEELGWEPSVSFEEGIAATIAWYRANEDWWRPIKEATGIITWDAGNATMPGTT